MNSPISYEGRKIYPAPFTIFTLFVGVHLVALFLLLRYLLNNIWLREISAGAVSIIVTFAICHLIVSFGEFFFHRYILHILTAEVMATFYRKHLKHHTLTFIYFDENRQKINSSYPIANIEQDESSTFPHWTLLAFMSGFVPVFIALGFLFPHMPIVIGGSSALTLSYYLYEVLHSLNHHIYEEWWAKKINNRIFGKIWAEIYGFHQAHHANYKCNMAVGGFFGLPVADILFGTYKQPGELLLNETPAAKELVQDLNPKPRWPIDWLDRLAVKRKTRILEELAGKT